MKLPGVSVPSTPVSFIRSTPIQRYRYMVTPLALPAICPATVPLSINQCGPRMDPLNPPLRRRTAGLETPAVHLYNHQRAVVMQQKEYCRFHQSWQRPFYGSRAEKEEYRKEVREVLKRQMREKWEARSLQLAIKMQELAHQQEADQEALSKQREEMCSRAKEMRQYRDENKRLMEQCWRDRAVSRSLEKLKDRELLQYNPLNWSCTLK
ncbi:uncharacterized protein LOC133138169 [Conger conger]|uniref:uncharacterized protein LOC133138169 n=1 Tax=Conger conger TaxID=82655 RepID=UPI002A5A92DF|nr:uncharacterized protein LOC133138169 [Conger conger]XP_061112679.1 uncharacterized protein LOC133138169 [Conger conger]